MKIGFVNQTIDTIVPPNQNSVGVCTYGLARSLSKSCEVVVYGSSYRNNHVPNDFRHQNIHFRLMGVPLSDRVAAKVRAKSSDLFPIVSPASTSGWLFRDFGRRVAQDLRREACDIIHVQQCSQYVPVIRRNNRHTKIVLHLHNRWFSQMNRPVLERRLRDVDLVTTVSDFVTHHIQNEFPSVADRCETSYNGIDANEFVSEKLYLETAGRLRRLLFVGAVSPHSGVHVLLEALRTVVQRYPQIHLSIVGHDGNTPREEVFDLTDHAGLASVERFYSMNIGARLRTMFSPQPSGAGKYLSYLKELLAPDIAGKVTFCGGTGDRCALVQHYYDADVFVFPPVCDHGFGLPPVEAMAAGVPCVATRSGATVETIRDNETGFLVEKNDPAALALAILRLLDNDRMREAMGRAARRRALAHFTWDRAAQRTLDRYLRLCGVEEPAPPEPGSIATDRKIADFLGIKRRTAATETMAQ
jgi:glycosyltransferase involved in cell wall biosynthesis